MRDGQRGENKIHPPPPWFRQNLNEEALSFPITERGGNRNDFLCLKEKHRKDLYKFGIEG